MNIREGDEVVRKPVHPPMSATVLHVDEERQKMRIEWPSGLKQVVDIKDYDLLRRDES